MSVTETTSLTRAERLDRLPFGKAHHRLLWGSGVGWALDAMDVGLISFVMVALRSQWHLSNTMLSWIGSIGFIGMMLGASIGGLLADRIGRRQVFAGTLLVYGIATGASAFAGGVAVLIILRFLVGTGLGAELPVASTLVSEYAPAAVRGRMVVMLEAFWAVGWIAAAALGYFVVAPYPNGWRWALAIGIVPTLYALVVRFGLPESVRFLESRGRHDEAERAVQIFETGSGVTPVTHTPPAPVAAPNRGSIWSAALRNRTAALWLVWFCVNFSYYGAFIWIPSLLHARGMTMTRSFGFTLIITLAQLPGYAVAAWLIEVWGRRSTLAIFLVGSALSAAAFSLATTEPAVIAAGCALSFFNLGAWGALYAIGPEIYPTSVRSTAAGAAAAFGRIASILAPLSVPLLMRAGGTIFTFGVFGAAFLIAALAAATLPERRHLAMTE